MRLLTAALLAFVLVPSAAAAMWDGVRWNMSAPEVLAAGKGRIQRGEAWTGRRVKPTRRPALMLKDLLEGEREFRGLVLHAVFWFDPVGRLWSIGETFAAARDEPASQSCARLEAALIEHFGPADLLTEKGEERHFIWRDEERKTRIHFLDAGAGGDCAIEYRELRGPLDR
jgi:hypothetical protein